MLHSPKPMRQRDAMLSYIVTHNMTYTVLNAFSWNAPLNVQGRTAEGNGS